MLIHLSVPSKSFLVGEYAVLEGAPSLILTTQPRFEVIVNTRGEGRCEGVHPNSPAGCWVRQNREQFEGVNFEFKDPFAGRGGFGASSAQFILSWVWQFINDTPFTEMTEGVDAEQLLKDYLATSARESGIAPSGADVVAQTTGGLVEFKNSPFALNTYDWPFGDLDFLIVPTGDKVATHEHLSEISRMGLTELGEVSTEVCHSLKFGNEDRFLEGLRSYGELLFSQKKVSEATQGLLKKWSSTEGVLAAKGCGALGADAFVLIIEAARKASLAKHLSESGLEPLASSEHLAQGLCVRLDMESQSKSLGVKQIRNRE